MKELQRIVPPPKRFRRLVCFLICVIFSFHAFTQTASGPRLEKMPEELETDFALSSMPPHVRAGATVYLLDPAKGYYIRRQGTNGFICFVLRTEWEWGEFRSDIFTPISYDAEGARTIFPVYADVETMRASGKYTAARLRDTIAARYKRGYYIAPARPGLSYMVAPIMRTYNGSSTDVVTMNGPHYMFYAPYLSESDIGGNSHSGGPMILGDGKGPHGYIIVPAGVTEKAKIMEENSALLKRLADYKPYLKFEPGGMQHH